jgi:acetoacetyl-CoA synthetase
MPLLPVLMSDIAFKHVHTRAARMTLVSLKAGTRGPALFIVAGLGGTADAFVTLGTLLGTPMPAYAIELRGLDGLTAADTRVEDMARQFLQEIKLVQPRGPYFLSGNSFGGLVAFEMARVLVATGDRVSRLILFDTPIHSKYWPSSYFARFMIDRALIYIRSLRHMPLRRLIQHISHGVRSALRHLLQRFGVRKTIHDPNDPNTLTPAEREVRTGGRLAMLDYCPSFYPGKMIYITGRIKRPPTFDPDIMWRGRVQELEVLVAEGDHLSMWEPPNVARLARDLDACLSSYRN